MSTDTDTLIHEAAAYLASHCDWALSEDGAGFSKADASFGHGLAETSPEHYDVEIAQQGAVMLRKYRRQLTGAGFDITPILELAGQHDRAHSDSVEDIKAAGRSVMRTKALAASKQIDFDGKQFVITFKHDHGLVSAVRNVVGRRWDSVRKVNTAPHSSAESVAAFAAKHEFMLTDEAAQAIVSYQPPTSFGRIWHDDTFGYALLEKGTPAFYDRVRAIKGIASAQWRKAEGFWRVSRRDLGELVSVADQIKLDVPAATRETVLSDAAQRSERTQASRATSITEKLEIPGWNTRWPLYPFQEAAAAFCLDALEDGAGVLVGDEMGIGKTPTGLALAAVRAIQYGGKVIVICPATLKGMWVGAVKKFLGDEVSTYICSNREPSEDQIAEAREADVVVINFDILGAVKTEGKKVLGPEPGTWTEALIAMDPAFTIIDEAHYIKEAKSRRTRASGLICAASDDVALLTGTPFVNRPAEGLSLIKAIDRVTAVAKSEWDYLRTYTGAFNNGFGWDFSGATNKGQLNERMRESFYVRRLKSEVLTELPPKTRSVVPVEISNRRAYDKAEAAFAQLVRRRMVPQGGHLAHIEKLRQLAMDGKKKAVIDWVRNFLTSGDKLVVFAHHIDFQKALYEEFADVAVWLKGGDTDGAQVAVDAFQEREEIKLIVVSIAAGQAGHTLTAASCVAYAELDWTPKSMRQSEDRLHRIGQEYPVNVYRLVAEDTVDETMAEMLAQKELVVDAITDGLEYAREESKGIQAMVAEAMERKYGELVAA